MTTETPIADDGIDEIDEIDERGERGERVDRRSLLRRPLPMMAAALAAAIGAGCDITDSTFDADRHLVQRLTFGADPDTRARLAAVGRDAWVDEQFAVDLLDTTAVDAKLAELPALSMSTGQLLANYSGGSSSTAAGAQLKLASLIRMVHSPAQLHERMVEFWSDHFNVPAINPQLNLLKIIEDREVIRPHALGRFADLLVASAQSPAMLVYLDNARSSAGAINENYGRELLELHTVGVNGGYDEDDVVATARLLTGWTVDPDTGEFWFRPARHDPAALSILDWSRPAGGDPLAHGEDFLRHLAVLPSTADFVCRKIAVRFVSDTPSPGLVQAMADAWLAHDSDIEPVLRAMIDHADFDAAPRKFRRPLDYLAMIARAAQADIVPTTEVGDLVALYSALVGLGQAPFEWPAPNGYPDVAGPWSNSGSLLNRWNLAADIISGYYAGIQPDGSAILAQSDGRTRSEIYAVVAGELLDETPTEQGVVVLDQVTGWDEETVPSLPEIREALPLIALTVLASTHAQYR
ncbi:MAG: DUF1800 domain-containing protein [Acidimicrobiales bacterium]